MSKVKTFFSIIYYVLCAPFMVAFALCAIVYSWLRYDSLVYNPKIKCKCGKCHGAVFKKKELQP